MVEQRKYIRRRTLLNGRLEIEKLNGWAVDCAVRNVSEAGARVTVPGERVVPDRLSLKISNGRPRQARLVWYRGGHAGLELIEERRIARLPPEASDAPRDEPRVASLQARIAAIASRRNATPLQSL